MAHVSSYFLCFAQQPLYPVKLLISGLPSRKTSRVLGIVTSRQMYSQQKGTQSHPSPLPTYKHTHARTHVVDFLNNQKTPSRKEQCSHYVYDMVLGLYIGANHHNIYKGVSSLRRGKCSFAFRCVYSARTKCFTLSYFSSDSRAILTSSTA